MSQISARECVHGKLIFKLYSSQAPILYMNAAASA